MSIKLKVILLSAVPVILTVLIMAVFFYFQITKLGDNEIESFERLMIASKKTELKSYIDLAYSSIESIYDNADANDEAAKKEAAKILMSLHYGDDGYVFATDFNAIITAHRVKPELIGKDMSGYKDSNGVPLFKEMVNEAKKGGGYVEYVWPKASKNADVAKLSYAIGLDK